MNSNKYNPYVQSYLDIKSNIETLEIENKKFEDNLDWINLRNKEDLYENYDVLKRSEKTKQIEIKIIRENNSKAKIKHRELIEGIKSPFNPSYYFSDTQKKLRLESKLILKGIFKQNLIIKARVEVLEKVSKKKIRFQSDIDKYNSFNLIESQNGINNNILKLKEFNSEKDIINKQKQKVEIKLTPVLNELKKVQSKIEDANSEIKEVERFSHELDNAHNSYERAMIHKECVNLFGDGNPNKIFKNKKELIKKLKRDFDKLENRAEQISEKAQRIINEITIDGNNMCYDNDKFIGFKALIPISSIINKDYKLNIIFDASIRSILKQDSKRINKQFDNGIKIHIVASKQKADETILDLASEKFNSYVISNDRFVDFFEKEVVENNRIFRHEIVNNRVLIHALDINITI